ncbi:LapA family protein [Listeria weihenstephanensis]|uniref:LapA family protein n=1 Tax=Listeria weihenstephanensis TaxID=1006155 RepID=A0A841ZCX3_9LIST|nr:LapA family protein [Listeria weihenstephanensis]MBC1502113.1 LapA family protein [Listeria weihenstephanensis]
MANKKISVKAIIGIIIAILFIIFAFANWDSVRVSIVFMHFNAPLVFIILGSAIMGSLITLAFKKFKKNK